jgi:hypothetical protein
VRVRRLTQMSKRLRFGVGSATGPRSSTWILKAHRNDVYLTQRRIGRHIKVSFHETGPWRFALTTEHLASPHRLRAPAGRDPRGAHEWPRPPADAASGVTRAFAIVIPWFEVRDRPGAEAGDVVWAETPPRGSSVEFDVFFVAPTALVTGHPGARSMGTRAVGSIALPNGERVFVVWWTPQITDTIQKQLDRLLSAEVLQDGKPVAGLSMLAFVIEEGLGVLVDVTLPDVVALSGTSLLNGEARCPRCGEMLGTQDEERAKLLVAMTAGTMAGVPVHHERCGQYFRVKLEE